MNAFLSDLRRAFQTLFRARGFTTVAVVTLGVGLALCVCVLTLGQGALVLAIGLGLGVGGAIGLGRLIQSQLFGVDAADPSLIASATLAFALCGLLAMAWPARRAALTDPAAALRE